MADSAEDTPKAKRPKKLIPNVHLRHRRTPKKEPAIRQPPQINKSAAFQELVEAAQHDATWERGTMASRQSKRHYTSAVAFGGSAKTSVPVERKKIVWSSNESIPKTEPEIEKKEFPILEPEYKDEWGARPFYFPMGEKTSQSKAEETRKLLPQYVQNRLAEIDSDDTSEEDVASAIGLKSTSSASPTSVAAKQCVLVDSDGVLFQLPSVFPSPLQDSKNSVSDVPCAATELPEGKIGKLQIYKSGKVRLKMGEVILDVNEGTSWGFHQQLVAINVREDDGHCVFLGDVKKRAICTLNTSQLL